MSHYLLLKNMRVENANAISGFTYGFPSPSNFCGYTHALSRKLKKEYGTQASLGGVGIICHQHQVHAHSLGYDKVFALTRNPLNSTGKTKPFYSEEGRMHMTVSLLIECKGDIIDLDLGEGTQEQRQSALIKRIRTLAEGQRLAGGTITELGSVQLYNLEENSDEGDLAFRRLMLRLIPGFVLTDRHDALLAHHQNKLAENPATELLDSWLDFIALDFEAHTKDDLVGTPIEGETPAEWRVKPKPEQGYFVPIVAGFEGISDLYKPGTVLNARRSDVPFRFVEAAHSIGQWVGPHRIKKPDDLLWHYHYEEDASGSRYLCKGGAPNVAPEELESSDNNIVYDDDF